MLKFGVWKVYTEMVNAESEWDDPGSNCYTRSEIQGSKLLNQSLLDSRMKYFGLRLRQIVRQMLQKALPLGVHYKDVILDTGIQFLSGF